MHYQEYTPPKPLRRLVRCAWVFRNDTEQAVEDTIVADGLPELIFHCGVPGYELLTGKPRQRQARVIAAGQLTRPLQIGSPPGASILAVRFEPWGLAPFMRASMDEVTDARCDASECLFGDLSRTQGLLDAAPNEMTRVGRLFESLMTLLTHEHSECVSAAVTSIEAAAGDIRVAHLADDLGVSRRKLELSFRHHVGVTPKQFARIVRFRRVHQCLVEGHHLDWVRVALESGFFDQPHLVRDFRQFAGRPPGATLRELQDHPSHFSP